MVLDWFWLVALPAGNEINLRAGFRFANPIFGKSFRKRGIPDKQWEFSRK
jgi:hypothetical protein